LIHAYYLKEEESSSPALISSISSPQLFHSPHVPSCTSRNPVHSLSHLFPVRETILTSQTTDMVPSPTTIAAFLGVLFFANPGNARSRSLPPFLLFPFVRSSLRRLDIIYLPVIILVLYSFPFHSLLSIPNGVLTIEVDVVVGGRWWCRREHIFCRAHVREKLNKNMNSFLYLFFLYLNLYLIKPSPPSVRHLSRVFFSQRSSSFPGRTSRVTLGHFRFLTLYRFRFLTLSSNFRNLTLIRPLCFLKLLMKCSLLPAEVAGTIGNSLLESLKFDVFWLRHAGVLEMGERET